MRSRPRAVLTSLILLLIGGCTYTLPATHGCVDPQPEFATGTIEKVALRYLGSGGIYLRWRDDAILIGPSFSNPGYLRAKFLRVKPNEARIRTALEQVEVEHVRAIFAGHSHYDHIGDIPAVVRGHLPDPDIPIHLNATGRRALAGEGLNVQELVVGKPVPVGSSMRVRAVRGGHAPQLCRRRGFPCIYGGRDIGSDWTTPLTKHRLAKMGGGQTLALVIELLGNDGDVRYRIYYNDASPDSPLGQTIGDFDLAILTVAQWNWARDYPRDLLAVLQPRHVLISHWDNFFAETTEKSKGVAFLTPESVGRFTEVVETYVTTTGAGPVGCGNAKWTLPAPLSTLFFNPR